MKNMAYFLIGALLVSLCLYLSNFSKQMPEWDPVAAFEALYIGLFIFATHEVGHAIAANRVTGVEAGFTLIPWGIGVSLLSSWVIGFPIILVGAVTTSGDEEQLGKIALAGPMMNYGFVLGLSLSGIFMQIFTEWNTEIVWELVKPSAWFGFFNLLPIPPLDGAKVFSWRPSICFFGLVSGIFMLIFAGL